MGSEWYYLPGFGPIIQHSCGLFVCLIGRSCVCVQRQLLYPLAMHPCTLPPSPPVSPLCIPVLCWFWTQLSCVLYPPVCFSWIHRLPAISMLCCYVFDRKIFIQIPAWYQLCLAVGCLFPFWFHIYVQSPLHFPKTKALLWFGWLIFNQIYVWSICCLWLFIKSVLPLFVLRDPLNAMHLNCQADT